jgi:serine O-acetyltransferase
MAMHQINPQGAKLAALDPIWDRVRTEAEDIVRREPELASFIYSTVLHHDRLEDAVVHRLADRLDHAALSGDLIRQTYDEALREDPDLGNAFRADLVAVYDRDPATSRFIDPLLRRYSRPTSIPQPGSAAEFSSITLPDSYAARPPWSRTTSRSCTA